MAETLSLDVRRNTSGRTFTHLLMAATELHPHRIISRAQDRDVSFEEHARRTIQLASAIRNELGIGEGDRVAVLASNSSHYLEVFHACLLAGAVVTPLNARLSRRELDYIVRDCGAKVCFYDNANQQAATDLAHSAGFRSLVVMGDTAAPEEGSPSAMGLEVLDYESLLESGDSYCVDTAPDGLAALIYTGGTSGTPKGVMLGHEAVVRDIYKIATRWANMTEQLVYLHQTPMFHSSALAGIWCVPLLGGTCTYVPEFDAAEVMTAIERWSVTVTVMVPTTVHLLLEQPGFDCNRLRSLKAISYGAAPMPTRLLRRLGAELPQVDLYGGYGMTEACGHVTSLGPAEHRQGGALLRSAGSPLLGTRVSIRDSSGEPATAGSTGEIWVGADNLMRGYWAQPGETDAAFHDGWFRTGDLGYLDGDGRLYVVDRVNDRIISGGENVYPAEVEEALLAHPAVAQVAVIGVPDVKWGEAVHAVVLLRQGQNVSAGQLKEHCRPLIAGYKIPKSVEFRTGPLPISGTLKVMRSELRQQWERCHDE